MKFKVGTKEYEIADDLITKAITDKTSVLELITDAVVRTTDEDAKFVENMKKDARKEGVEIAVKKIREEKGLTFEGKTIENLLAASTEKAIADAKLEPQEAVQKIEAKLKEKNDALTQALNKVTETENKIKNLETGYKINGLLDSLIPKNTLLPVEDIKTILKSKMSFRDEEGNITVYDASGNQIKNPTTKDPMAAKDVIEDFFKTNTQYMKPLTGGAGGNDSGLGEGKVTVEQFIKSMQDEKIAINSPEYTAKFEAAMKDGTIVVE